MGVFFQYMCIRVYFCLYEDQLALWTLGVKTLGCHYKPKMTFCSMHRLPFTCFLCPLKKELKCLLQIKYVRYAS